MRRATEIYMNKSALPREAGGTSYCAQSNHVPCWVPQIKDIIDPEVSKSLKKCPTVWDYMCEMQFLMYIFNFGPTRCPKPCKTWHYKFYEAGRTKMGRSKSRLVTANIMYNISNIIRSVSFSLAVILQILRSSCHSLLTQF